MTAPMIVGTVEDAYERLEWLASIQDSEVWAAPAAFALCRRLFDCWPEGQLVPFFCTSHEEDGAILIDDDEHAVSIRVSPASIALVVFDWITDAQSEQYTSLDTTTLRSVLPRWLEIIERSETFDEWKMTEAGQDEVLSCASQ